MQATLKMAFIGGFLGFCLSLILAGADCANGSFTGKYSTGTERTLFEMVQNQTEQYVCQTGVDRAQVYGSCLLGWLMILAKDHFEQSFDVVVACTASA